MARKMLESLCPQVSQLCSSGCWESAVQGQPLHRASAERLWEACAISNIPKVSEKFAWGWWLWCRACRNAVSCGSTVGSLENYLGVPQMDLCCFVSAVGPCPTCLMAQAAFLSDCCSVSPCSPALWWCQQCPKRGSRALFSVLRAALSLFGSSWK